MEFKIYKMSFLIFFQQDRQYFLYFKPNITPNTVMNHLLCWNQNAKISQKRPHKLWVFYLKVDDNPSIKPTIYRLNFFFLLYSSVLLQTQLLLNNTSFEHGICFKFVTSNIYILWNSNFYNVYINIFFFTSTLLVTKKKIKQHGITLKKKSFTFKQK